MVGTHPTMLRLYEGIRRAAPLDVPVLVQGPTGSGKELVAQALHALSGRRGSLVPVNVGTIPEQLAESELFGSVRGAYTGAVAERMGLIESARDGTLFLDEATELSLATQVRLLRVLETGAVRPVGGTAARQVEFRLVLCVQQPVWELVAAKRWREDFYYRVAGVALTLSSLEERSTDIALLADHWLERLGRAPLAAGEAEVLMRRSWPGNVRELRRAVERAAFAAGSEPVGGREILDAADSLSPRAGSSPVVDPEASLTVIERRHIERVLRECGNRTETAARVLGLSLGQLYRKYRALGIVPPRGR